jgi:hypothetical protein
VACLSIKNNFSLLHQARFLLLVRFQLDRTFTGVPFWAKGQKRNLRSGNNDSYLIIHFDLQKIINRTKYNSHIMSTLQKLILTCSSVLRCNCNTQYKCSIHYVLPSKPFILLYQLEVETRCAFSNSFRIKIYSLLEYYSINAFRGVGTGLLKLDWIISVNPVVLIYLSKSIWLPRSGLDPPLRKRYTFEPLATRTKSTTSSTLLITSGSKVT